MHALPFAALLLATVAAADDFRLEPGFELLFKGDDLAGWRTKAAKDRPSEPLAGKGEAYNGRFRLRGGELVIDPKVKGDVIIETVREFGKETTIRFDFKPDAKCNNDLFIHGQKFDLSRANVKNIKDDEWNPIEIALKDGKITFTVNGEVVRSAATKSTKSVFGVRAEFGAIQVRRLRAKEG